MAPRWAAALAAGFCVVDASTVGMPLAPQVDVGAEPSQDRQRAGGAVYIDVRKVDTAAPGAAFQQGLPGDWAEGRSALMAAFALFLLVCGMCSGGGLCRDDNDGLSAASANKLFGALQPQARKDTGECFSYELSEPGRTEDPPFSV
mmetsp:Transcript_32868/g.71735  ORF Transcript_32868/g.71735 Transcript_32868/m.71735 type:complete len:146 (+) Transcript_32868:65-502(+)